MIKWMVASVVLGVGVISSVQVTYAANPVSQQQVNDLFCNSSLPIPSNLCPASSPTGRNPASQKYVCERYLAAMESSVPVEIGDTAGGGIVYFVDSANRQGLIAATTDAAGLPNWGPTVAAVTSSELFTGEANTTTMLSLPGGSDAASAAISSNPAPTCAAPLTCTNWYLPSQNELSLLWDTRNLAGISGFATNTSYWSSTQVDSLNAWNVYFGNGYTSFDGKYVFRHIRPVRSFTY